MHDNIDKTINITKWEAITYQYTHTHSDEQVKVMQQILNRFLGVYINYPLTTTVYDIFRTTHNIAINI